MNKLIITLGIFIIVIFPILLGIGLGMEKIVLHTLFFGVINGAAGMALIIIGYKENIKNQNQ